MKHLFTASLPILTAALTLALFIGCITVGYTSYAFPAYLTAVDGLENVSLELEYYDSFDKLRYDTTVSFGGSAHAAVMSDESKFYTDGVLSANGASGWFLECRITLPEGAELTQIDPAAYNLPIAFSYEGNLYYDDYYQVSAVTYQYYLTDSTKKKEIPLAEPRTLTEDDEGQPLYIRYALDILPDWEGGGHTVAVDYSKIQSFAAGKPFYTDDTSFEDRIAYIEYTGSGMRCYLWDSHDCLHADVRVTDIVGTTPVGSWLLTEINYDSPQTLLWFSAEGKNLLTAVRSDNAIILQIFADGQPCEPYNIPTAVEEYYAPTVRAVLSNGAACFRVRRMYGGVSYEEEAQYFALSMTDGSLLAHGKTELTNVYHRGYTLTGTEQDFDALWLHDRLYVLDNAEYHFSTALQYDYPSTPEWSDQDMLTRYGGGMTGYFVTLSVMDADGEVSMNLHPLNTLYSGNNGSAQRFIVRFAD
ncbi:MAG: hypothetical protein IJ493_04835 [Clostridia bacterium]|nr:hypothetical protein [Clostridia bacterium]